MGLTKRGGADVGRPTSGYEEGAAEARELAAASLSPATIRAYTTALRLLDAWLAREGLPLSDSSLAAYLGALRKRGATPNWGNTTRAAVKLRAEELQGGTNPAGRLTRRVMAGWRRTDASERTPKQAPPMLLDDVAAVLRAAGEPRMAWGGMETPEQAAERAREDAAIVGLSFYGGLRRSEISALRVADVDVGDDGVAVVRVRRSKANQDGAKPDVRAVKGRCAAALAELAVTRLRAGGKPEDRLLPMSPRTVARRIERAGKQAGLSKRLQGHSGRVGLAVELTARGASTVDVMLAGGWKSEVMVAQYAAPNRARRGAVARLL